MAQAALGELCESKEMLRSHQPVPAQTVVRQRQAKRSVAKRLDAAEVASRHGFPHPFPGSETRANKFAPETRFPSSTQLFPWASAVPASHHGRDKAPKLIATSNPASDNISAGRHGFRLALARAGYARGGKGGDRKHAT